MIARDRSSPAFAPLTSLHVEQSPDRLRISWENRRLAAEKGNGPFSMTFAGVLVAAFWAGSLWLVYTNCIALFQEWGLESIQHVFLGLVGIALAAGLPWIALRLFWVEWIEVSETTISWGAVGPLAPAPKVVPIDSVAEVGYGTYQFHAGNEDSQDSEVSLNVFPLGEMHGAVARHQLALFASPERKAEIFNRIQGFVWTKSIPLRMIARSPAELYTPEPLVVPPMTPEK